MTDNEQLHFITENMEQGEVITCVGINSLKALLTVLIILGAFISGSYLISLNDSSVYLQLAIYVISFTAVYVWVSKLPTLTDFFITDKIDDEDILGFLIQAQLISWSLVMGLDLVVVMGMWLLSGTDNALLQAIGKIVILSLITTVFFIYTKRERVWIDSRIQFITLFSYTILGFAFGICTYSIGGVIVIASEFIGWGLTIAGIGLEVLLTSVYTYMDLQNMVRYYKEGQISKAEREERERKREEDKEMALRLLGKYDL